MKITKARNGDWCVTEGRKFKIVKFDPNLRRVAKKFTQTVNVEDFITRLKKYHGIKPKDSMRKMMKVKAVRFGGCWNIRTLNDELLFIHDPEISEKERNRRR
jgi:hypothetical protein